MLRQEGYLVLEMEEGYSVKTAETSKRKVGVFCVLESKDKGKNAWFTM